MKIAKTITHILFPVFIGLIIGGAIFKNTAAWVSGLVLLIIDIIVGIAIQYFMQKPLYSSNYSSNINSNSSTSNSNLNFNSVGGTIERCKELFNKAEPLLNSEYNDGLFGIDLDGNKRPLAGTRHSDFMGEVLDSSVNAATAAYLAIDDLVISPSQYLKKSIQDKIMQEYGELTPYSTFLFLNYSYAKKHNLILVVYKGQETCFGKLEKYTFPSYLLG